MTVAAVKFTPTVSSKSVLGVALGTGAETKCACMLLPCERVCQPQWWRFLSNPRPVQPEPARPTGALFKINLHCSTVTFQCRVSFRRPAKRISHPCTGVPSCLTVCPFTAPQCVEQSSGTSSGFSLVVQFTQGINLASVSARLPAPPSSSPLVSLRLFSTRVSLFLLCRK